MPRDPSGKVHTGSVGLFDDPDEIAAWEASAEAHEISRLEGQIRRRERKEEKAARRAATGKSTSRLPSFINRILGRETKFTPVEDDAKRFQKKEYVIVRKPPTPDPVYTAEDVEPVDSPWLRECGMVMVRSKDPGGCHIVPKSMIEKSE